MYEDVKRPGAEQIEKTPHPGRVGHPAKRETGSEQGARQGRDKDARDHDKAPIRKTVITPVAMKVSVATIERCEKRLIPHTPCPLVQPLPIRVPNPTSNPAIRITGQLENSGRSAFVTRATRVAPSGKPIRKAHALDLGRLDELMAKARPAMPDTPAMRPSPKSMRAAARPMRSPPANPSTGAASGKLESIILR